jgi:hypothetical protein
MTAESLGSLTGDIAGAETKGQSSVRDGFREQSAREKIELRHGRSESSLRGPQRD